MRKFWGFYDNGKYKVGCNGQTMYLYDADNHELAKFRDIPYAYRGAFKPGSHIFVLRSTEGRIAVYDCEEKRLLRKFRFSNVDYSQDDGYCFSPDGAYFLNIERIESSLRTRLSIYETETFTPVERLFENDSALALSNIEYNAVENRYNILYFVRDSLGVYQQGYIGMLEAGKIVNEKPIHEKIYRFLNSYQSLRDSNFTDKAMEWSGLHYAGYTNEDILNLRDRNFDMLSFLQIAEEVIK